MGGQEFSCCIVCSPLLLLRLKCLFHVEVYLAWLCIFCFIFLILRGWDRYAQSHASGFLWGVSCVFIILYLRGLYWWCMSFPCSVNGHIFFSRSWFSILIINDHRWFLGEGVFFILGMECCFCAEFMVLVVSWFQLGVGYIVTCYYWYSTGELLSIHIPWEDDFIWSCWFYSLLVPLGLSLVLWTDKSEFSWWDIIGGRDN